MMLVTKNVREKNYHKKCSDNYDEDKTEESDDDCEG